MIDIKNMPIVLKKYIDLKDNIDINNLTILNEIFEKIDEYELKSTNVLFDNLIIDGLIMNPSKKEKMNNLKNGELENILKIINQKVDKNLIDINEVYFYNTFIKLINKFEYISFEEQVILNFLFEEIKEENKELQRIENGDKKYIIK